MQLTIELDDTLYGAVKGEVGRSGDRLDAVVAAALRAHLATQRAVRAVAAQVAAGPPKPPDSKAATPDVANATPEALLRAATLGAAAEVGERDLCAAARLMASGRGARCR